MKRKVTIETYKGKSLTQPWRWRVVACNGQVTWTAHEGYASRSNALRSAKAMVSAIRNSPIEWA